MNQERRRFPRYPIALSVLWRKRGEDVPLLTVDVSRHGAFVRVDPPPSPRQLVQLRFRIPGVGDVDAMCMVARALDRDHPRGPGIGVDFFALSKEAKAAWETFIQAERAKPQPDTNSSGDDLQNGAPTVVSVRPLFNTSPPLDIATLAPVAAKRPPPLPTSSDEGDGVDDAHADGDIDLPLSRVAPDTTTPMPAAPTQATTADGEPLSLDEDVDVELQVLDESPQHPLDTLGIAPVDVPAAEAVPVPVVVLRLPDRVALRAFAERDVARGGMFLKTPLSSNVGDKIDVVVVHPEGDQEFRLHGNVIRRVVHGPPDRRGLGIFFRQLSDERQAQLRAFVETGAEEMELTAPVSERQLELEERIKAEPDNAEALEALGAFLLDEEADLGGALTHLTRALVLAPQTIGIHATLARAYRKAGDAARARAHDRVAEALTMLSERKRVSMGV